MCIESHCCVSAFFVHVNVAILLLCLYFIFVVGIDTARGCQVEYHMYIIMIIKSFHYRENVLL